MTWSYNVDYLIGSAPVNLHAQVRLLIGDTVECDKQLEDEEITWVIAREGGVWMAAIGCVELMLGKIARQPSKSVGALSRQDNQKVQGLKALKETLSRRAFAHGAVAYAGGISRDDQKSNRDDTDWDRPTFTRTFGNVPVSTVDKVGGLV